MQRLSRYQKGEEDDVLLWIVRYVLLGTVQLTGDAMIKQDSDSHHWESACQQIDMS